MARIRFPLFQQVPQGVFATHPILHHLQGIESHDLEKDFELCPPIYPASNSHLTRSFIACKPLCDFQISLFAQNGIWL